MATYNKRGYKAPKPKEEAVDLENGNGFEEVNEQDSTTAGIFNTLDESASKTEDWVIKNQKIIMGVVGAIALITAGYLLFVKFVEAPKEEEAANKMFMAQKFFQQATDATTATDSLYTLALKGGEGQLGFEGIIEEFSGTKSENLAQYYAGISYYNLKDYKKAVDHLSKFSSDDEMIQPLALGTIGDAFAELNKNDDALEYYGKAAKASDNEFTAPRFLWKQGQLAIQMGKKDIALNAFKTLKEKYETSQEAANIDSYIAMLE